MNIAFFTLGCKVNQFETQSLELLLTEKGHKIVDDCEVADVIVINTCTVTSTSDQKSRRLIRHVIKTYPNARVAVCGCLSQINPDSVSSIDGVKLISGTADKVAFAEQIDKLSTEKQDSFTPDNPLKRRTFENLPAGGLHGHTRALLKIEDGCSNFCTYCIIPYTRGPVRSLPLDDAISECGKLAASGYNEIVVTGIEISSYGRDLSPKLELADVVSALCRTFPEIRFRLGSIEPTIITDDFCVKLKNFSNLCPHFHLSMQSGCDETLARMRRKYTTERFFESVSLLRKHFDSPAITTDMIVGFPGETEEEFFDTLNFIEKCRFSSMHIFPYSRRAGTKADKMPDQITKTEKTARAKRASEIANKMEHDYLMSCIGKTESVLLEEMHNGYWTGHAKNSVRVYLRSNENLQNKIVDVKISSTLYDGLLGEIIKF